MVVLYIIFFKAQSNIWKYFQLTWKLLPYKWLISTGFPISILKLTSMNTAFLVLLFFFFFFVFGRHIFSWLKHVKRQDFYYVINVQNSKFNLKSEGKEDFISFKFKWHKLISTLICENKLSTVYSNVISTLKK